LRQSLSEFVSCQIAALLSNRTLASMPKKTFYLFYLSSLL